MVKGDAEQSPPDSDHPNVLEKGQERVAHISRFEMWGIRDMGDPGDPGKTK